MTLKVISECVDRRTGKRYAVGDSFPAQDLEQVDRLIRAGCLRQGSSETGGGQGTTDDVAAKREEAASELAAIDETIAAARRRRDEELAAIENDIAEARAAANARISELQQEQSTMTQQTDPAAIVRAQINEDGLFEKTVAELRDIAEAEGIDLGDARRKEEVVAGIRASRAAKA